MSTWQVTERATGTVVYAYTSDEAIDWPDYPFASFNHNIVIPVEQPDTTDADWRIYVGAFFDRFGASKLGILSSDDAMIQAAIKDCSVRKYIDLKARRDELAQTLGYVATKGFALDIPAVLDTEPTDSEVWQPFIL